MNQFTKEGFIDELEKIAAISLKEDLKAGAKGLIPMGTTYDVLKNRKKGNRAKEWVGRVLGSAIGAKASGTIIDSSPIGKKVMYNILHRSRSPAHGIIKTVLYNIAKNAPGAVLGEAAGHRLTRNYKK